MKSFYSLTLVLGALVMAYWPSMTQGASCPPKNMIPLEKARADMNKAVAAWKNAPPAPKLESQGGVSKWECYNQNLLPGSACADYAKSLFQELAAGNPKEISGSCSGTSNGSKGVHLVWTKSG
ncbi:MAG: hypothetical protein J3Q66DRAFT_408667 [Benniella sp.]|nr:MAG: hypothetical protein J3Q66DRAFT_408667 [Benniella sp.]